MGDNAVPATVPENGGYAIVTFCAGFVASRPWSGPTQGEPPGARGYGGQTTGWEGARPVSSARSTTSVTHGVRG